MAGCDGNALRSSELEHRLHILAEEGSLYRHLIGQMESMMPVTARKSSESQIGSFSRARVNDAHHHQFCLVADDGLRHSPSRWFRVNAQG